MDALETLVRDVLHEHAREAPTIVPELSPRRRRWLPALAAALLVAGLAVAAVAFRGGETSKPAPAATFHAPPGYQPLSYHGITLAVPADMPVETSIDCGGPDRDYVLAENPWIAPSCPQGPPRGRAPTIALTPIDSPSDATSSTYDGYQAATVGGVPALRDVGGRVLVIKSIDVVIDASHLPAPAATTVIDSVTVTPVNYLGCPDRLPRFAHSAPHNPSSVSVCEYSDDFGHRIHWLIASGRADTHEVRLLDGDTLAEPDGSVTPVFLGRFGYPDGSSVLAPLEYSDLLTNIVR